MDTPRPSPRTKWTRRVPHTQVRRRRTCRARRRRCPAAETSRSRHAAVTAARCATVSRIWQPPRCSGVIPQPLSPWPLLTAFDRFARRAASRAASTCWSTSCRGLGTLRCARTRWRAPRGSCSRFFGRCSACGCTARLADAGPAAAAGFAALQSRTRRVRLVRGGGRGVST